MSELETQFAHLFEIWAWKGVFMCESASGSWRMWKWERRFGIAAKSCKSFMTERFLCSIVLCLSVSCVFLFCFRFWFAVTTWGTWTWMRSTTSCPSWWRGRKTLRWRLWSAMVHRTSCGSSTATFTVSKENSFLNVNLCCVFFPQSQVVFPPSQSGLSWRRWCDFIFPEQTGQIRSP